MTRISVYLSLGGNIGHPLDRLRKALNLLSDRKEIENLEHSHFYSTLPFEMNESPSFVNVVCRFETSLDLKKIFSLTQEIETFLGKVEKPKNVSRPIDIDILFYGADNIQESELEIPHPRWKERLFVLIPLSDLTNEILICTDKGKEHFNLKELIPPLLQRTPFDVSLLEKNPDLK